MKDKNPLDYWAADKIGAGVLTRKALDDYQLDRLRETVRYAKQCSRYYRESLDGVDIDSQLNSLEGITHLPFTAPEDLISQGHRMICVNQGEISRIVTLLDLDTSGTTGKSKRVYFTEQDQEITIDYFHKGMQNLMDGKDVLMILLPFLRPGSVGDLLKTGVERMGASVVTSGYIRDAEDIDKAARMIRSENVTSVVGLPGQVAALSDMTKEYDMMKSVLLTAEFVSDEDIDRVRQNWGALPFEHYGMTEMGLGGAVSCAAFEGYHLREADMYFEIIDDDGNIIEGEEWGELVFTTLTRKGMPLIRYRTGDVTRWINSSCPCGSPLRRIDRVRKRKEQKEI